MAVETDITVIGAGVSGLATAGALGKRGWRVQLLEARARTGGRILSAQPPGWPRAVDLGAEFVHGGNPPTQKVFKKAGMRTLPVDAKVWWRDKSTGVLALLPDYWGQIARVVDHIPRRVRGWSFHEFLQHKRSAVSPADRILAEHYVGSFEAAPTKEISARTLREDRAGTDTNDFKIAGRYDRLIHQLEQSLPAKRVGLTLCSPVTSVQWKQGEVTVKTKALHHQAARVYRARAVVVTLPLGVLQAGTVKFSPNLRDRQKLIEKLGWGHVVRIGFCFKKGFWSAPFMPKSLGAGQGRNFGFVNAPGLPLPVWWTLSAPAAILTGWAGGDVSRPLRHCSPATVRDRAIDSLAAILSTSPARLMPWLVGWQCHQWSDDPFSLGSYSFPVAGLETGAKELARPISSTIFFAGEATAEEYGTVHGALESGLRAAADVHAAFRSTGSGRTK